MEYTTSSILSMISHIHACSADYTNRRLAEKTDLVSSHGFILYLLSDGRKISKGELTRLINRDKSTTTVLIKKLLNAGLVKEETCPEDGRSKILSITKEGKKYNALTSAISKDLLSVCWKDFSCEEKESLLLLLGKMLKNLEEA